MVAVEKILMHVTYTELDTKSRTYLYGFLYIKNNKKNR